MRRFFLFICLIILLAGLPAKAYTNPGQPSGFVNDFASILSQSDRASLESKLQQFSKDSSNEISVVTITSLGNDTIENFAVKLFADWKIGKEKQDNGVLLLVAMAERQMRIEVGYGLEGALTDSESSRIIRNNIKPAFQKANYYQGIDQAVDQIIAITKGEYSGETSNTAAASQSSWKWSFDALFFLAILGINLLVGLRHYFAKTSSWWAGGVLGGVLGLIVAVIFFSSLFYFIIWPLFLAISGLIFDFLASRVWPKPKNRSGRGGGFFWGGGFGGRGGGSGSGFGGFGGGGSGGGGSSGSW